LASEISPRSQTRRDAPHPEARLQVVEDVGERRDVGGVAGKDVVGDRDAVAGDEETDHDLGTVRAVIA
jgi:hypothetical protein